MRPFKMTSCIFVSTQARVTNAVGRLPGVRRVTPALRSTELLPSPWREGRAGTVPFECVAVLCQQVPRRGQGLHPHGLLVAGGACASPLGLLSLPQ